MLFSPHISPHPYKLLQKAVIFETQQLVSLQEALRLLKEGNARFVSDTAVAGNITEEMRQSLVKDRKQMKLLDSKLFF